MNNWYVFTPTDTLFCKGAEPMMRGENHTASHIFPPPAHTFSGAVRTAVLEQNNISFNDYKNGSVPTEILHAIGKAGDSPPFEIAGPLFMLNDDIYIPAPYSWYVEEGTLDDKSVKIFKAKKTNTALIKSNLPSFYWAQSGSKQLESLGGAWLNIKDVVNNSKEVTVKKNVDFFTVESRTGISLQDNRRVRKRYLYSFSHVRLHTNVQLLFGLDNNVLSNDRGVLKLGAEQRFGQYRRIIHNDLSFKGEGDLHIALSLVAGTDDANNCVVACGKISYLGGWDMSRGFHKPMRGYFPPGSVFSKKLCNNFMPIEGE